MVWKVAIIGGGPGGLAAAIALTQLNEQQLKTGQPALVDWTLYEKKPRISETGGGISIQRHTWRMLELLGVADRIDSRDVFRPEDGRSVEHRNAVTGVLIARRFHSDDTPPHQVSGRMVRAKLQKALLSAVDGSKVRTGKKLVSVEEASSDSTDSSGSPGVQLTFADGESSAFDLVIGADGIRSVVRSFLSPSHKLSYNGQSAYRTILRKSDVEAINGIPKAPIFWQYVGGKYVYTCPLGGDDFELTARIRPDINEKEAAQQTSWGQPYDLNKLLPAYADFAPPLRQILKLAADVGGTQEFAMFNGPRLETVVKPVGASGEAGVLLLGDASHPLSGAFGAGAGFAFEDAYTLARALSWAHDTKRSLSDALWIYDNTRSPHYSNLYKELDRGGAIIKDVSSQKLPLHDEINERVKRLWLDDGKGGSGWVYLYHADEVVEEVIQKREKELIEGQQTQEVEKAPTPVEVSTTNGQSEQPVSLKDVVVPVVQEVVAAAA